MQQHAKFAITTGATFASEELGNSLDGADLSVLCHCRKVIILKEDAVIMDTVGEKADTDERDE